MTVPQLRRETRWECPSCGLLDVTYETAPHTRFHSCGALRGLTAPMVVAGTRAEHRVNDRQDYEGSDIAQRDDSGRVVMSVTTVRDDGQDVTILAPTVVVSVESLR